MEHFANFKKSLTFVLDLLFCYFLIMGNEQSVGLEQLSSSSNSGAVQPKPVKSAFRQSRSVRSDAVSNHGTSQDVNGRPRYLPKMSVRNEKNGGIIMPTRPFGDPAGNGVESPQWGWYTNITPPTPDYSHPSRISLPRKSDLTSAPFPVDGKPHHNHVFQSLQGTKAPMQGWTSVPM
jgi:hypothetical protein